MKRHTFSPLRPPRVFGGITAVALIVVMSAPARAGGWGGIEPLKSRRADVERVLGKPLESSPGEGGALRFKVNGGLVTVAFIDERFAAAHKLSNKLVGTVRQIVLQHERASDTPESLGITTNKEFKREDNRDVSIFRNARDGVAYTFIGGRLRTSYFTPSTAQLRQASRG